MSGRPRAGRHRFGLAVFHLELLHGRLALWETQTWSSGQKRLFCSFTIVLKTQSMQSNKVSSNHTWMTVRALPLPPDVAPPISPSSWHETGSGPPPHLWSGLTDWLMARPAHKSTFSQNCKPNLPNVKFVHRSLLFALKSYFNTFPNYTWVTKNLHLRAAFLRLFPAIKMLTWMEPLLKLLRFTARASPRCI